MAVGLRLSVWMVEMLPDCSVRWTNQQDNNMVQRDFAVFLLHY